MVVFFVLIVLTIGIGSYFSFMRARRLLQYRQLFGEFAYELARAGLELTRGEVTAALDNPDSEIYKSLVRAQNEAPWKGAAGTELAKIDFLSSTYMPLIERVATSFGGASNVSKLVSRVVVRAEDVQPFQAVEWAQVLDTRQKCGRLFIEVESTFKAGALLEGISKKIRGYYEFRVMSPLVPVLNHFTLALTDPLAGGQTIADLNGSETDFRGILSGGAGPIVLNNGDTIDADEAKATMEARWLARQGLVYLGSKDDLRLNLAFSFDAKDDPKQAGEDFQFYQESAEAGARDLQRFFVDDAVKAKLNLPGWEIRFWDMGVSKLEGADLALYRMAYDPAEIPNYRSSLLRLMGAPPNGISPTLVLGKVHAGLLRLTGAHPRGLSDPAMIMALLTLLPAAAPVDAARFKVWWDQVPQSGGSFDAVRAAQESFAPGKLLFVDPAAPGVLRPETDPSIQPKLYSEIMSQLTTRPYNRGLLHFKAANRDAEPTAEKLTLGLPAELFGAPDDLPSESLNRIPKELLLAPPEQGIFEKAGVDEIFGKMAAGFPDPLKMARKPQGAKNSVQFLKAQGYLKPDGTLDLGTSLSWEGAFSMPDVSRLARGGIIVADSFQIDGGIGGDLGAPPLLLYARTGNIRLSEPSPVHAILLAPKGVVEAPKGMRLSGAILAQGIDFKGMLGRDLSHLQYNPRFKVGPWSAAGGKDAPAAPGWSLVVDHSSDFIVVQ